MFQIKLLAAKFLHALDRLAKQTPAEIVLINGLIKQRFMLKKLINGFDNIHLKKQNFHKNNCHFALAFHK